jgi:hypothetical protein
MTNPINPGVGAPSPRTPATESRPKSNQSGAVFTVPSQPEGDSVAARPNISFGSLGSLVNTELSSEAARATAQRVEKLLGQETLPLVNNRPQVVSSLMDSLLQEQEREQK